MADMTRAEIGASRQSAPNGMAKLRRRFADLKIGGRLALGFAASFALALGLGLAALLFMQAVLSGVDGFSRRSELTGAAAELDISLRRLEIAVRDQLAEGDVDSFEEASHHRDQMAARLETLAAAAATGGDRQSVAAAQTALAAYWDGFRRIVELKEAQANLTGAEIPRLTAAVQAGLERLKDVGGVDSATLVNDAALRIAGAVEMGLRFTQRNDMMDGQKSQAEFAAIRDSLEALNRYRWVSGTVEGLAAVKSGMDALEAALDRLDLLVVEQDALRADALTPNAAVVAERAQALRRSGEREAAELRGGLAARAGDFATVALWIGGAMLVLGLGVTVWAARSVSRPVRDVTQTLTALAAGRRDAPLPVVAAGRNDEIADLARAVAVMRDNADELGRALDETAAERDRLAAEVRRLAADNAAKSDFLVNLGQLLHGPLTGMAEQAQELMTSLHGHGLVDLANDLESMQWTGERLAGQLDALMDYAAIEAGRMELCLQDFDVARLAVEARERAMTAADLHGVTLTATTAAGVGGMHSDFAKVRQALLNLLDNACAHAGRDAAGRDRGDGAVSLAVERVERDGRGWMAFTVTDNGPGFVPQQAAHLFRPFVKGARRGGEGAGLGLTLAAHYLALLGGELEIVSAPGRGARFTLLTPAVYAAGDEARALRVRLGEPGGPLGAPAPLTALTAPTVPA